MLPAPLRIRGVQMDVNKVGRTGLFLCLLSTAAVGQDPPDTKLLIVVYDAAHVGSKTLERSERLAGTIVFEAGIQSSWDAGPVADLGNLGMDFTAERGRECQVEPISGILRLQILPHAPPGLAAQALGFSLPCARRGVQVTNLCGSRSWRKRDWRAYIRPRAGLCDGA